jgi:IS30 family transposase
MIAALRQQGCPVQAIAANLGRHRSTIYRELKRNQTPYDGAYRPTVAIERSNGRRSRSRRNARYQAIHYAPIEALLKLQWSPDQIVGWRRRQGMPVMSHETIYLHIWKDKTNGGSLWRHLRGGCKQRRKRYGRKDSRGRLAGKRPIEDRPACVERRTRFGDWEADTVHGRGKPCVVTTVERKSGFVRIGPLPNATVDHTNQRIIALLRHEPHRVFTITSDNGTEFHGYKQIEQQLGTTVYFATPHHAWERGTNENTNGLIRQYLPKGTSLAGLTQERCNEIARLLNHRPRRRHAYRTPHELYYASVPAPSH